MNEKEKQVKAYIFICQNCNHEWINKKDDYACPECKCTILDYQKLR
jgi:rubrerythrin